MSGLDELLDRFADPMATMRETATTPKDTKPPSGSDLDAAGAVRRLMQSWRGTKETKGQAPGSLAGINNNATCFKCRRKLHDVGSGRIALRGRGNLQVFICGKCFE